MRNLPISASQSTYPNSKIQLYKIFAVISLRIHPSFLAGVRTFNFVDEKLRASGCIYKRDIHPTKHFYGAIAFPK